MSAALPLPPGISREQLLHMLYEAAELEHCLMCTYLYAAFSLRTDESEGLSPGQLEATRRWRRAILQVATEEMGHLVAVWNITSALGGAPRVGRYNFPLDVGALPASVSVKLAPFNPATLQHFVYLERPAGSDEPEGDGFGHPEARPRAVAGRRITPMPVDYDTVGEFYAAIGQGLRDLVAREGEAEAFCGDPALQLTESESGLKGCARVICQKTALAAFDAIVLQGEGASVCNEDSHYRRFSRIRDEYAALRSEDPEFVPGHPAATNPLLRPPQRLQGRVWIQEPDAVAVVDLANSVYGLMLRLLAYVYAVPGTDPDKALAMNLALGLMHAFVPLAELAARLPASREAPGCNAGVSFVSLRDPATLPPGAGARRFYIERCEELAAGAGEVLGRLPESARAAQAADVLAGLARRARTEFNLTARRPASIAAAASAPSPAQPPQRKENGVEYVEGADLTLLYEGKRCIHARFCVTGAPTVFLANVQGPWIHPDTVPVETLVEIAHACPSGAIRYQRKDGQTDEGPPPVNLLAVREAGPYAVRGELLLDGAAAGYRATLCRCGASQNKPFCDGSHKDTAFTASGEPPTGRETDMLVTRDGPLRIDPERDGPLQLRGNLEITSGTGRVVARTASARLCRCGASGNKPFCDGSHARVGFKSESSKRE